MSDIFFKLFYNDVKDKSWPAVETYCDFLKMPEYICNELIESHNLIQRLEQIESQLYWQTMLADVYCYENLAFLPLAKCGSVHYKTVFVKQLGWKLCKFSDLAPGTVCFGMFEEPMTRYLKGITEWAWVHLLPIFNNDIAQIPEILLKTVIVGDLHSLPYTVWLGPLLDKINCIPIHRSTEEQTAQYLTNLFKTQNHNIKIPIIGKKLHASNDLKLKLYNHIKQVFDNYLPDKSTEYLARGEATYLLLSPDLKFYRNLLSTFDPTWQKIKFIS